MACRGVHFALTGEDEARLRSTPVEQRPSLISDEIEERYFAEGSGWLCETDKAWDAIHRAFNASELDYNLRVPLQGVVLGGEQLYFGDDYIISLKNAGDVRAIAAALMDVTKEGFRSLYDRVDPEKYGLPLSDDDFEYAWSWLDGLKPFYIQAAKAGRSVIFTTDQ